MRESAKQLTKGVAIYGIGDAVTTLVNFLLLPIYVKYQILTTVDYGALALILSLETFSKIIVRWGLDGAFMRFYHDRADDEARRRLASTLLWFMAALNSVLLAAALLGSARIAELVSLDRAYVPALRLMFVNMALMAFTFVPMHTMRLRRQATVYSAFTFARSAATIVLRIALVIGLGLGITGMYVTDLAVTIVLLAAMWPWIRPCLGWTFSFDDLRQALRFSLPRLPAGAASQALDSVPRLLLGRYFPQSEVGVYQNGATLGSGVAFFKTAFETAWAPFYYETARTPDAKVVFSKMATYGIAVLAVLVAGTVAVARDVILLVLRPEYLDAVRVVPLIGLAMGLQGVYQLTSIGLNLTNRTEFYSVSTMAAAGVGLATGLWWIPAYGVTGAAATVLAAYTVQVVLAAALAHRLYPVHYEISRIVRVIVAGVAAAWAGLALPEMTPLAGFLARGAMTVAVYAGLLAVSGFFRASERAFLRELVRRLRRRSAPPTRASAP